MRFKKLALFRLTELCIISYSFQCVLAPVTDTSLVTCLVNLLKQVDGSHLPNVGAEFLIASIFYPWLARARHPTTNPGYKSSPDPRFCMKSNKQDLPSFLPSQYITIFERTNVHDHKRHQERNHFFSRVHAGVYCHHTDPQSTAAYIRERHSRSSHPRGAAVERPHISSWTVYGSRLAVRSNGLTWDPASGDSLWGRSFAILTTRVLGVNLRSWGVLPLLLSYLRTLAPLNATVLATVRDRCNSSALATLSQKIYSCTGFILPGPTLILRTIQSAARAPQALFDRRLAASLEYLLSIHSSNPIVELCLASYIGIVGSYA